MQSVPITTNVVRSNPTHGEVYFKQHYVINFVSDLRQICGFLRFPPPIKLTPRYNWNIVESSVKHHNTNQYFILVLNCLGQNETQFIYSYNYRDDFFQLFNWFQLFSCENCFPKVVGHGQNRSKMTILKGGVMASAIFHWFSNQYHSCN
jgi:hypothetical protein